RYTARRRRWKWLLYQYTKVEALHTKQAVLCGWYFATGRRWRKEADSFTPNASLPFETWDRLINHYIDKRKVPSAQVYHPRVFGTG
ncbi:unnamed protein product, partial [Choristocarpus tenellus]